MPKGAKKRKAAKKKKEQENNITSSTNNNNNNNNNSLGNDDPKSQDERESDGGDTGSPSSQDHNKQQNPFNEGSEESEKRDPSAIPPFDSDNKSMEEVAPDIKGTVQVGAEGNGTVKIPRELESKDNLGGQNSSIKHVEFSKESPDGSSSSSSSSSSSDNESQEVGKASKNAIQSTENASFGKADDSVVETAPATDLVKPLVTVSQEAINVTESDSYKNSLAPVLVESRLKENEELTRNEDDVKPLVTVAQEAINVTESDSYKNSLAPVLVESRLKENEELMRNEDDVIPPSEENVEVSWTVVEPVTNENEGKSLPLSAAPESSNAAGIRDSKITESSENQPLLAPAPRVEQRTSWMSCCGLFDVVLGSSR